MLGSARSRRGKAHESQSGRRAFWLRRRLVHRTNTDVVHLRRHSVELLLRVRRQADERVVAEHATRPARRQIVLPQVDPVRAHRERHVRPVVDDEQRIASSGAPAEHRSPSQQVPHVGILLTQLHDVGAGTEHALEKTSQVAPCLTSAAHDIQRRSGESHAPRGCEIGHPVCAVRSAMPSHAVDASA